MPNFFVSLTTGSNRDVLDTKCIVVLDKMVSALNKTFISAGARAVGAAYRIHDAQAYPSLYWATVLRESFNVATCGAAVLGTNVLLKPLTKQFFTKEVAKAFRKHPLMEAATTILPAIAAEILSRRVTGYNMSELISKEFEKHEAQSHSTVSFAGHDGNLIQWGDTRFGVAPRFEAISEKMARVGTHKNPFAHAKTASAVVKFN
jgi:hypothetical protein